MKKGVIFFVSSLVFFLVFMKGGSAQTCTDDQIIFRASSNNNAHLALWDVSTYDEKICFNQFFQGNYNGSTPHNSINPSNKVLGLSNNTNAHAQAPNETSYASAVYYGDLKCEVRHFLSGTSGAPNACDGVVSYNEVYTGAGIGAISGISNAHYARIGGGNQNYPWIVCCASNSAPPITSNSCGNGQIDPGEDCDGGNLGDLNNGQNSCVELSEGAYVGGEISCTSSCKYDTSACVPAGDAIGICLDDSGSNSQVRVNGTAYGYGEFSCTLINNMNNGDLSWYVSNRGFLGNLNQLKEEICEECDAFFGGSCEWRTESNECQPVSYEVPGCGTCSPSQTITQACDGINSEQRIKTTYVCTTPDGPGCSLPPETEISIVCPKVIQLSVFGWTNFVFATLLIAGIYLFVFRNEND